jgi:hypothetical protein
MEARSTRGSVDSGPGSGSRASAMWSSNLGAHCCAELVRDEITYKRELRLLDKIQGAVPVDGASTSPAHLMSWSTASSRRTGNLPRKCARSSSGSISPRAKCACRGRSLPRRSPRWRRIMGCCESPRSANFAAWTMDISIASWLRILAGTAHLSSRLRSTGFTGAGAARGLDERRPPGTLAAKKEMAHHQCESRRNEFSRPAA